MLIFLCIFITSSQFMDKQKKKTVVNSWNEWDALKHIILGRADGCCIPPSEPAVDGKVPEDSDMRGQFGVRPKETIDRANELLENFANLLKKRGIRVDRPTPLNFDQPIATPDWKTKSMFGTMPARDIILTVGKEMLEATMSYRCRWFEYLNYRPLLKQYYDDDPGMRHESAPKPRLTDKSFRMDYLSEKIGVQKRLEWTAKKFFVTTEEEPLFDAADVMRFGKDLMVQHGFTTNLKGIDWLRRHFPNHRVHALNFPGDPYPIHIDATFTVLKPGLIINNPNRRLPKEQRKIFDDNKIDHCDFAKIDCEGSEYSIMDTLPSEYLKRIHKMAIEYHFVDSKPELAKNLISKIENANFHVKKKSHYNDMGFLYARK